ncbi:MAG: hypothetical protein U0271_39065 [Polyangiaceae bacterium]
MNSRIVALTLVVVGFSTLGGCAGGYPSRSATAYTPVRTSGGSSSSGDSKETSGTNEAASDSDSDWGDGRWDSRFGRIKFVMLDDHKVTGEYSGGTLDCTSHGRDLACTWTDTTGSGRCKFHWSDDGDATGTFGLGDSDSDQGAWDLSWTSGARATFGSTTSSSSPSSKDVVLVNDCSNSVPVCVMSRGNGSYQQTLITGHSHTHVTIDVGGAVKLRSGSSCGNLLGDVQNETSEILVCK